MRPLPFFPSRVLALCAAVALTACANDGSMPVPDEFDVAPRASEESAPLGGEGLAQRKRELDRAQRDLEHFHATLQGLRHRNDHGSFQQFVGFLDTYLGRHVDPLLASQWQSGHPELMAFDANLRLVKAELLIHMREPGRAQRVVDELRERFQGRENMLVDFPVGERSTLEEAIQALSRRKWWRS